ncbi:GNAT family N-acetyltransferase [Mucilaginibacter ginsenosidivorax]|uniref:GNAT family N-acetyltransferase n=1 Tax=Mucilaginibacter ginsenosidivorax TaxID=862126 RepID=A0A5B8W973_9SPHI|nr:GNAT family N-acetyltransferase [Mucilaginibacter ginsenosidivorax]QEC80119.1 GNAT family N-acetyltransferase [Mucilaginibacter ginsenosidivorax]
MTTFIDDSRFTDNGFIISTDKHLLPIDVIYNYLNDDSYWAQGISRTTVEKAIENSMCFGVYKKGTFAGFARVVTDKATFAYLCDVFILPEFRRLNLSKWLMQTIVNDPDLQGLRRWSLATADAHGLYEQFGFSKISKPERWMEIFAPYIKPQ